MGVALYLDDSYLREFEAKVVSANGKFILLDQTAFYPNSGGQPHDEGTISKDGEVYKVVFVGKFDGDISHEVDKKGLKKGDKVSCKIDWDRRYFLMRMHTSAHIINEVVHKETGALISGNQLGLEKTRVDFNLEDYHPEKIESYITEANNIINKDLKITSKYMPRDEALKIPNMVKLAGAFPPKIDILRIVSIGDFDTEADGGTHVKSTKEIGKLKFLKVQNKGKNNRRLYYTLV